MSVELGGGRQALTLTFSEPVEPTSDFDPRQFRLSVGVTPGDGTTTYFDTEYFWDPAPTQGCCDYCYCEDFFDQATYTCDPCEPDDTDCIPCFCITCHKSGPNSDDRPIPNLAEPLGCEAKIRLWLDRPLSDAACERLADDPTASLYLHYTTNGPGALEDSDAEPLPARGAAWAESFDWTMDVPGELPDLNPALPIPEC